MANPFALVIPVGCRYLFLFLSIYTAPYSPYLQHVQSLIATVATASFDFGVRRDVGVAVDMADVALLTTMVFIMTFIKVDNVTSLTDYNLSASRRVWDPGIWPNASRHHEPRTANDFGMSLALMASTMPTVATATTPTNTRLIDRHRQPVCLLHAHHDSMARPLTPSVSIFHYCHPVLSRPTVPNIDS